MLEPRELVARALPTVRILWAALLASHGLLLVALLLSRRPQPRPPPVEMIGALYVVAGLVAAASFVLPRFGYARSPAPAIASPDPGSFSRATPRFADPPGAARQALALGQTAMTLGMALSESVTLFGFVLGFQGAPDAVFLPLFVAGAALAAMRFPTAATLLGPFERRHGARFGAG